MVADREFGFGRVISNRHTISNLGSTFFWNFRKCERSRLYLGNQRESAQRGTKS